MPRRRPATKAAALKSFEKAAKLDSSKELSKNLLLANLANGNTAEAKKYAAAADAQAKAAMAAAEGDYKAAAKNLEGYNAAIALVQSNDLAGAKKAIAKDNSADADYLRAVIAAKEGDPEDRRGPAEERCFEESRAGPEGRQGHQPEGAEEVIGFIG